uniref:Uncharacterized protein n=1 Tax=Lepeophtheirus salmonis TaxID=72036 RepID=A0A0K2V4P8_LEPSM
MVGKEISYSTNLNFELKKNDETLRRMSFFRTDTLPKKIINIFDDDSYCNTK